MGFSVISVTCYLSSVRLVAHKASVLSVGLGKYAIQPQTRLFSIPSQRASWISDFFLALHITAMIPRIVAIATNHRQTVIRLMLRTVEIIWIGNQVCEGFNYKNFQILWVVFFGRLRENLYQFDKTLGFIQLC